MRLLLTRAKGYVWVCGRFRTFPWPFLTAHRAFSPTQFAHRTFSLVVLIAEAFTKKRGCQWEALKFDGGSTIREMTKTWTHSGERRISEI